ncbi:MAG: hypothetical protein PHD97_07680 [Bacteroidales bacterium]|nr:hypothetical protein [Bacteroidales bacterium]
MKKLFYLFVVFAVNLFYAGAYAQVKEAEKTYEITGKAKRGALANVDYDLQTGNYALYYVTKSNDRMAKFQIYNFDREFNFIKMDEQEVDFDKAKTQYKWFSYKGDEYSVVGNQVEGNLTGTLVLKKKKITYSYDWILLGYHKKVDVLDKVKPKTEDGRKFFYYAHAEDESNGDILILCGIKAKAGDDPFSQMKNFVVLKYNSNLELISETPITFNYVQSVAYKVALTDPSPDNPEASSVSGMVFVFAPMGGPGMNKAADPDINNYTYVRIDNNPKVVDKFNFKSPASYWNILECIKTDKDVYLFGPSMAGKEKYYNMITDPNAKYKAVQLMKVSNGQMEYITETTLEDFEAKLKFPPGQKEIRAYRGKKFNFANYKIATNGDFFVIGQNFDISDQETKYKDVLSFHFDSKGILKSQYGVDLLESNKYSKAAGCPQNFIESPDGKNMYWLLMEIKGVATWTVKPLTYPRIGKIDLNAGSISEFQNYGAIGKKDYYLDPKFPFLETDGGNKVVFFGSDESGRQIWFCRVNLK